MPLSEFEDTKWMMDLAFLVDITQELNNLNLKLQGPGQLVTTVFDDVKAFTTEMKLWKKKISQSNHTHFPSCKSLLEELDIEMQFNFRKQRVSFQLFADPFSVDVETAPSDLQM
ncbi:GT2D2 protein, partial [Polyodon spathula]|nr:GT2D2 protein [Polyodon spathula]